MLSSAVRLGRRLRPSPILWIDRAMFSHVNSLPPGATVLNVGSGEGTFDHHLRRGLRLINLDVTAHGRTELVGDAHALPVKTGSVDAAFSNAVLEHVRRPWLVAAEMVRVLKPCGLLAVNVPFLNVIHDTHDYYRFTDAGLDVLFSPLEKVAGGVSAGPGSFAGVFFVEWMMCLVPLGKIPQGILRLVTSWLVWPVKFLDWPLRRSAHLRVVADGFYYVGRKPA